MSSKLRHDATGASCLGIAVDETSARRGHRYVTNVLDCDGAGLLLMIEGRSSQALGCFAQALCEHGGNPAQIRAIAMDMSPAYLKGAAEHFPQAQIVFDKFHVMQLAGQALDTVRRQLQQNAAQLKGALWSLRGNAWNLSAERQQQRRNLCTQYTKLGRAMTLRETLQAIYASSDRLSAESQLHWWCSWASRSRLEPFRSLAKTVRQHWEGILAYFDTRLTSAAMEAVNGIVQLAKRMARGFKNFIYFRTAAYLRAARLKFDLPTFN
jgi:transposase